MIRRTEERLTDARRLLNRVQCPTMKFMKKDARESVRFAASAQFAKTVGEKGVADCYFGRAFGLKRPPAKVFPAGFGGGSPPPLVFDKFLFRRLNCSRKPADTFAR